MNIYNGNNNKLAFINIIVIDSVYKHTVSIFYFDQKVKLQNSCFSQGNDEDKRKKKRYDKKSGCCPTFHHILIRCHVIKVRSVNGKSNM
jgi:hypothetical protein